jgi:type II secretory pathway pseudopilin PulG
MKLLRSRRQGLTLIEITVSLSLFTLIVVPVLLLLLSSRRTVAESRHAATARMAIEHQLERMRGIANVDPSATAVDFEDLAALLVANPTFEVRGLPAWQGGAQQGVVYVCLDETKPFFTNDLPLPHDDYFALPGWDQVPYAASQLNLDASFSGATPTFTALGTSSSYRVLPVRVEVFWGQAGTDRTWNLPKVAVNAVIAPKTRFRRG